MVRVSAVSSTSNSEAMKMLCRKGLIVHPPPTNKTSHPAFIQMAMLAFTIALSPEDRELLSYLMSVSKSNVVNLFDQPENQSRESSARTFRTGDHPTMFDCDCFRCYVVYWKRWNSSPNAQLIHEIMGGFEDWFEQLQNYSSTNNCSTSSKTETKTKTKSKQRAKKGGRNGAGSSQLEQTLKKKLAESDSLTNICSGCGGGSGDRRGMEEAGSLPRLMSFIGERVWRLWILSP